MVSRLFASIAFAWLCDASAVAYAQELDACQRLREELIARWESLGTLAFTTEEYPCDSDGVRDYSKGYSRIRYSRAQDGRRGYVIEVIYPDRSEVKSDVRHDGSRVIRVKYFADHPGVIEQIQVSPEQESPDDALRGMSRALWALVPYGRPVHRHLEAGATCERKVDARGEEVIVVRFTTRNLPIVLELDPAHDWLVRRATMGEVAGYEIDEYRNDNGRWFPAKGRAWERDGAGVKHSSFLVDRLEINRPIADSVFSAPEVETGVPVVDMEGQTIRVRGGPEATKARRSRYDTPKSPPAPPSTDETRVLRASRDPERDPWSQALLAASAALCVVAAGVWWRRR